MTLKEFCEAIGLPEEGQKCISAYRPGRSREEYRELFLVEENAFYEAVEREEDPAAAVLSLYTVWAQESYEDFLKMGVSRRVFLDTFSDLSIWYRIYEKREGRPGLTEWSWLSHSLKRRLFRIGSLQYQPRALSAAVCAGGREYPAGKELLEVHIPEGTMLDEASIDASMEEAPIFFERIFHKKYDLLHCHSWLLAPELDRLLEPSANIWKFGHRFTVYRKDMSFRQAEERVFGRISDDIDSYPEQTGLQKRLKAYLKAGGAVSMGLGIIDLSAPVPGGREEGLKICSF